MDSFITAMLEIRHLSKSYQNKLVLQDISFNLAESEILCLLGSSGCGKTTLLRLVAGLETPDHGQIVWAGQNVTAQPPHQRGFGLMFQEFALFPHKNVAANVAFGLHMKGQPAEETVSKMLELVGLVGFENRDVSSLSGGEQQRVALARSLAADPRLLMLDEPLGALDRTLRERLMLEIRDILKRVGLTAIYVTHDQTEAFAVADRIMVLHQGQVEQCASPEVVYHYPANPRVAQFLGFNNLITAQATLGHVTSELGQWALAPARAGQVTVLLRPEAASLQPTTGHMVTGQVESVLFRGRFYQTNFKIGKYSFMFELPQPLRVGQTVSLWLDPQAMNVW